MHSFNDFLFCKPDLDLILSVLKNANLGHQVEARPSKDPHLFVIHATGSAVDLARLEGIMIGFRIGQRTGKQ